MKEKQQKIQIFDSTLRDGTQAEGISLSAEDKVRIALQLDKFGFHYIEGGWPGSNPKDIKFFELIKEIKLKNAKISAFGSTRHSKSTVESDSNIQALIDAETPVITIFGKTWDFHVKNALNVTLDTNLEIIKDSVSYLSNKKKEIIYDAEHFFDGYKANPEYALDTLRAARDSGAQALVLCDTNGGSLISEVKDLTRIVKNEFPEIRIGIHTHNDSGLAVANSIVAVEEGATQIQGTINGFGERSGNANLCSIIPILQLKMGYKIIFAKKLKLLTELSRYVSEIANVQHDRQLPFVGSSAFAHKGGIHVNAIMKDPKTYEHIVPELVGNKQRILLSDLSGRSSILSKALELNIKLDKTDPIVKKTLKKIKTLENKGYQFEGADGSFELLLKEAQNMKNKYFDLLGYRVTIEKRKDTDEPFSEATVLIRVKGVTEHTAGLGNGPVNALDNALRKALESFYPKLKEMSLNDYKVRILDAKTGTKATTRVLIESSDNKMKWGTVGVSPNIIEASYNALVDAVDFKLHKDYPIKKKK
ncbi:MAG: citramalate synthase [Candidatus Ranarchaeia archaeon]